MNNTMNEHEDPSMRSFNTRMLLSEHKEEISSWRKDSVKLSERSAERTIEICQEIKENIADDDVTKFDIAGQNDVALEVFSYYDEAIPTLQIAWTFSLEDFFTKLEVRLRTEGFTILSRQGIIRPAVCLSTFNRRPDLLNLAAPPSSDEAPKKVRQKNTNKKTLAPASQPTEVSQENNGDTVDLNAHVARALKNEYKRRGRPVPYWEFVLDPDSLSNTVQNVYQVAQLCSLAKVLLEVGEDSSTLKPLTKDQEAVVKAKPKNQYIVSIDVATYRKKLLELRIREPLIKPINH